jgi:Rrf2 family protein
MSRIVSLSEAASIALHGLILIARSEKGMNAQEIADATGSSRHHVAKILQRLAKEGFLTSNRGPSGGFSLRKSPEEINLLELYEAIEGKITVNECAMEKQICAFNKCIFNNLTRKMTEHFVEYMQSNTLKEYI